MADQESDTLTLPVSFTQKQWDDYQKLRREKEDYEAKAEDWYNQVAERNKTIKGLEHQLKEQRERVKELRGEEKLLKDERDKIEIEWKDVHREDTATVQRLQREHDELRGLHEELKTEFSKLEYENRTFRDQKIQAQKALKGLEDEVFELQSEKKMNEEIIEEYQQEVMVLDQAQTRLQTIESHLKESSIIGRKLSKDISAYTTSEIYKLLSEVIHGQQDGRASPESFHADLKPSRQRPTRQVSMQDELQGMGEDLDSNYADSPTAPSFGSNGRSPRGSLLSPKPRGPREPKSPTPKSHAENTIPKGLGETSELSHSMFEPMTIADFEPSAQPLLSKSKIKVLESTTSPIDATAGAISPRTIIRNPTTTEVLWSIPAWVWALVMTVLIFLNRLFLAERATWLAANEITRQAVIHLRHHSIPWLHLPAHAVFNTETLLGVQKGLMG
ncbi:Hypothetical protein D9617_2g059310 [Elsinoe fawcettii]|nr:Hypothetical protein D9617_2g059310 [Elsinoe fawcettii]